MLKLLFICIIFFWANFANGQRDPSSGRADQLRESGVISNDTDVVYFLYTRKNLDEPIILNSDSYRFIPKYQFKIIIHGFTEHVDVEWYKEMIQEYLKKDNYHVIAVDWSKKSQLHYMDAVSAAAAIGKTIASFLIKLDDENQIQLKRVHVVGHSLGAHVSAFAAKQVFKITGTKFARITGLDPAGPLFEFPFKSSADRLSKDDAKFVDVIHTDGGILGFRRSIGDADFFPNGGVPTQPGCQIKSFNNLSEYFCSHRRSHQFFIESINSDKMIAKRCNSWSAFEKGSCNNNENVPFGENASPFFLGNFYLKTNAEPPYAV